MLHVVPAFSRIGEENAFAVLARAQALAAQHRDALHLWPLRRDRVLGWED